jgi:triacylglycerol lipase
MQAATTWQDLMRPGEADDFFSRVPMPEFDPSAAAYHKGNALWLAELSRIAYRHDEEEEDSPPQPTRKSCLAKVRLRERRFFQSERTGTQAILVESEGKAEFAALVFRGTEQGVQDLMTDLGVGMEAFRSQGPGVHLGFRSALDSVWPQIEEELSRVAAPVFFTGHSLGAALATLAAARRRPKALYTFGSPRVGNEDFVATLAGVAIYRVVDDADAVATLPPEWLGFRHAGETIRLKEPTPEADAESPGWLRRAAGPPKPLADHAPVNYVDRIV